MSRNGDVVWANGASWQRDNLWEQEPKQWWICPALGDLSATLKELKQHSDFAWVVLNGELVREGAHGEKHSDIVRLQAAQAKHECDIFRATNTTLRNKLVEAEQLLTAERGAYVALEQRVKNLQSTMATDAEENARLRVVVAEQDAAISQVRGENPDRCADEQVGNVEHVGFSDWLKQQTKTTGEQDRCDTSDHGVTLCDLPAHHRGCTCLHLKAFTAQ